jgi:superfamily II RNA helicase
MPQEFKLDPFQEEAINYSRQNHSVIVSAPTGAGKTLIAEHIIEDCIKNGSGVIYTAPIKALSNQKFRDFSRKYPQATGILTGDVSINRNAPILIMTTEIFRNAIMVNPHEFDNRQWVIFDEIHYLDDIERGTVWEEAIILLPQTMRMLALSATLPNLKDFVDWISKIHKFPIATVIEKTRPVPLHFFFQCNNEFFPSFVQLKNSGRLKNEIKKFSRQENTVITKRNRLITLLEFLKRNKAYPCLYFSFSRRRCEELAQEVAGFNFLRPDEKQQICELFDKLVEKFNVSSAHLAFMRPLIENGIAYHHAGLLPTLKEVIEQLFSSGLIKMIFTTETFALGINMPARTVTFDMLSKFYGRGHAFLRTRDFYQMAGRAGRRGIDNEGYVFSRINPYEIDIPSLEKIIYGNYEPIKSQLNSCYATILNLYSIMGEKIYDIYPNSFHFHQAQPWEQKEVLNLLQRKIALLKKLNYISQGIISPQAQLAASVYSFELSIGELFGCGYLDNLDEESLFVLVTALVYEPRKGQQRPRLNKRHKRMFRDLIRIMRNVHQQERNFRIYPLSKTFYFHLSEAAAAWYHQTEFVNLAKYCCVDEGEIIRYFRMAIQVLREMYSSIIISPRLKEKILHCLRKTNRDEVDAEKQLRQGI